MQNSLNGKNVPVSWAPWWTVNDIKMANFYINDMVTEARDKMRDQVMADFVATGEDEAYNFCKGDYESLNNGIADNAKKQGW